MQFVLFTKVFYKSAYLGQYYILVILILNTYILVFNRECTFMDFEIVGNI